MLNELFWIIFGALVGWVAAILQREFAIRRVALFIIAGMIGGLLGGSLGSHLTPGGLEYDTIASSMIFAVFGATAFVAVASLVGERDS